MSDGALEARLPLEGYDFKRLEKLLKIGPLETLLAESLASEHKEIRKAPLFFLKYLFASLRLGHLGVQISPLLPDFKTVWKSATNLEESEQKEIELLLQQGAAEIQAFILEKGPACGLAIASNIITTRASIDLEKDLAALIAGQIARVKTSFQKECASEDFSSGDCLDALLHEEQKAAIIASKKTPFFILTGVPGTGKTHTVKALIKAHQPKRCLMLAPTGKAAMQIQERLLIEPLKEEVEVLTLHRALGLNPSRKEPIPLEADLVIVDEASMVDAAAMKALLSALDSQASLILMGDPNQLPSVESGSIFSDLANLVQKKAPEKIAHLKTCHRVESLELVAFAQAALLEDADAIAKVFDEGLPELINRSKAIEALGDLDPALFSLQFFGKDFLTPQEAHNAFKQFRMLCPLRKGGVDLMNESVFSHLRKSKAAFFIPIIINRTQASFVNGQMGVLYMEKDLALSKSKVYFEENGKGLKEYRAFDLPSFEMAFCLSVHKSQGSEFDAALLFMPKGSEAFGAKALYTAITRAKKKLFVSGNKEVYIEAIQKKGKRISLLAYLLD